MKNGQQHVLTGNNIVCKAERGLFLVCDASLWIKAPHMLGVPFHLPM